jgi:PilX N-terminal
MTRRSVLGRHSRRALRRQRGIALVLVLLVVAALSLLGIVSSRSAQTELRIARKERSAKQALSVAEAGINHAYSLIAANTAARPRPPTACAQCWGFDSELSGGGTGGALGSLGGTVSFDGNSYRFRVFGGDAGDGYYARAVDNYDERSGPNNPSFDADDRIYLVARGRVGGAERVLTAVVTGNSMFPYGLFGKLFVTFSGGSSTDSFDSRRGPYTAPAASRGGVRSNGDIGLSGGQTVIHGDAMAGGDVTTSGGSTVTGTQTDGAPPVTFPSVPPCGPPYSGSAGITGGSYDATTGRLTASGGADVSLSAGTYCFSSIVLSGGSTLTITTPVSMYLTAESDLSGGSIANTSLLAGNLKIFLSLASTSHGIKLSGGTQAYAAIYAPDAPVTLTGGNTEFYGSIVSGSLTDTGGVRVHYDEALGGVLGPGVRLTGLREVRN